MTPITALQPELAFLFEQDIEPDELFEATLKLVGEALRCDRCFLYVRNPQKRFGRTSHCWLKSSELPKIYNEKWMLENPAKLEEVDPLFAAALNLEPSVFVPDIETASPETLNKEYERENLGHRALIHGHIVHEGELWGILQPCVFGEPRPWRRFEQAVIEQAIAGLRFKVVEYVNEHCPDSLQADEVERQ